MRFRFRLVACGAALTLGASLAVAACAPAPDPAPPIDVTWRLDPTPARVGPSTLLLTLRREGGRPISGAAVRIEGHMSHAGMAPLLASAVERAPGVYEAGVAFTMAGDWIVLAQARLPDGRRIEHRIDVPHVRPSP